MAQANNTPIDHWLDMPLQEFEEWILAAIELKEDREKEGA